jgi:hypothetical protein
MSEGYKGLKKAEEIAATVRRLSDTLEMAGKPEATIALWEDAYKHLDRYRGAAATAGFSWIGPTMHWRQHPIDRAKVPTPKVLP